MRTDHPWQRVVRITLAVAMSLVMLGAAIPTRAWANTAPSKLVQLRDQLSSAELAKAQAERRLADAQASLNAATQDYVAATTEALRLAKDADNKNVEWTLAEAAWDTANDELVAARSALEQNASDIAATTTEISTAEKDQTTAATALDRAKERVAAAQGRVKTAQDAVDAAQAAIASEVPDPGTNAGHREWTALGLFEYVRDNSAADSDAYWDAQCAIDILLSGVDTKGHSYKAYEGPAPDGYQAAAMSNIRSEVDFADRKDAVSLDNFSAALDYINEYNQYRQRENAEEGGSLSTDVGMNCRLMAIAAVQLDYAKDRWSNGRSHSRAYSVGENLSWGYADPFVGWYDEEKAEFKDGDASGAGHYFNIVDHVPDGKYNPTMATGFAVNTGAERYGVAHGQVFHTTSGYAEFNPSTTYSADAFRAQWFQPYYDMQVEAEMFGTTEAVKAVHRDTLAAAQAELTAAQTELASAQGDQQAAQAALDAIRENLASARTALSELTGKTAGLQSDVDAKTTTAQQKRSAADVAKSAYDAALAAKVKYENDQVIATARDRVVAAQNEEGDAKKAVADAADAVTAAQGALDDFTDLAGNGVRVTCADATYTGEALEPEVSVTVDGTPLIEGTDYTVSYTDNVDADTGTVVIAGTSTKGSGSWWGSHKQTFAIGQVDIKDAQVAPIAQQTYTGKALTPAVVVTVGGTKLAASDFDVTYERNIGVGNATVTVTGKGNYVGSLSREFVINKAKSSIRLTAQSKTYNGKALAYSGKVTKSGSSGKVTYAYFSDAKCTKKVTASKVKTAGTYYVKATVAADANHEVATSAAVKLTIAKAANPMTVKAVTRSAKLATVKKKAVTVKIPMSVSKAQGKLTYKKASGSSVLSINSKTGQVSVKKGTKKGTYKIKVKVTAAGNTNYKSGAKTVACTVVVK
ncbi:MAG: hypothetical protein J6S63_04405 [Atopobiaceae bacterium]|nr:hypothetical protein [Atopobiaceae bacterium]